MATSIVDARRDHAAFIRLGRTPEEVAVGIERVAPVFLLALDHEPGVWIVESVATGRSGPTSGRDLA
jgi:hypothetical protein